MQSVQALSPCQLAAASATCFNGTPVAVTACPRLPAARRSLQIVAMAGKKKVISNLTDWKKEFIGYGIFVEDSESKPVNIAKSLEDKKLLSGVEKSGLLSKLEGLGLSLSKIEKLKLLSTAEKLGVLSLLENAAIAGPGVLASAALPLVVSAILVPIIIPDDSGLLLAIQYSLAAALGLAGVVSFGASVALGILLD